MCKKILKIYIESLGCSKNLVDTERILGFLALNFTLDIVDSPQGVDIIILNTCGFIQNAIQESIQRITDLIKYKSKKTKFIVAGCLPVRIPELKKKYPNIDLLLPCSSYNERPSQEFLDEIFKMGGDKEIPIANSPRIILSGRVSAYLKISEGCSNNCSYCTIPSIRGNLVCFAPRKIIEEAKALIENGIKEINIISQDITSYKYKKWDIVKIIEEIAKLSQDVWIRVLYAHPLRIDKRFIEIYTIPQVCRYLDIPIQHCNDNILHSMNRKYTKAQLEEKLFFLRETVKDIVLRSTVIVGYPGETEKEFDELVEFIKKIRFERLGCFAYSSEEGTKAFNLGDPVSFEEKQRRLKKIYQIQNQLVKEYHSSLKGKIFSFLPEEISYNTLRGRTYHFAPEVDGYVEVRINSKHKIPDNKDFFLIKVIKQRDYNLYGEMV